MTRNQRLRPLEPIFDVRKRLGSIQVGNTPPYVPGPPFTVSAGYAAGGWDGVNKSVVDKLALPAETMSTLGTGLSSIRSWPEGFGDPNVAGYAAGGRGTSPTYTTAINKFTLPSDTRSTLTYTLPNAQAYGAGFADPAVAGYAVGGVNGLGVVSAGDKISFPSDTGAALGAGLSAARQQMYGFADPGVGGYVLGGHVDTSSPGTSTDAVDKYSFPSDIRSTLGTGLSALRRDVGGFADPGVAGYAVGGTESGVSTIVGTVDKFAFPTDTRSTLGTGLAAATAAVAGVASPGVAGYAMGGVVAGPTYVSTVEKIAFPSDTVSTVAAVLSDTRSSAAPWAI